MVCRLVENLEDKSFLNGNFILYKEKENNIIKYYLGVTKGIVVIDNMELSEKNYDYILRREGKNKCQRQSSPTPP